jgi:AmmeMemoRadiSam system protein A
MGERLSDESMRILLRRAAEVVEDAILGRPPSHSECPDPDLEAPRGIFVTLRRDQALAGCIGYAEAPWSLWETLGEAARSAALEDSRFERPRPEELDELGVEISVLTPPREIRAEDFVPGRHGLALESGYQRGLLLPQVASEHGLDHDAFLDALCQKAGIPKDAWRGEGVQLFAFEAQLAEAPLRELREEA